MPSPKGPAKVIPFPVRPSSATNVPPPPAAPQVAKRKTVEMTRVIAGNCPPGTKRRLYLKWIGSSDMRKRVEHRLASEFGLVTDDVMRIVRAEARADHRELFFARSPKAA
jgi:hypothetical protein